MAQSYVPAHPRRTSSASRHDISLESDSETIYHDLEPSAFIFPNPSNRSAPSSPYASSSALSGSIPTDFDVSSSDQSHIRAERVSSRERRRISASTNRSGSSWNDLTDGRSLSWDTSLGSPDVEVWDFTGDEEEEEIGNEHAATSSALGATTTVGRMSRWDSHHARHLQERRAQTRRPLQQAPTNVLAYVDRRQRALVHRQSDSVSPSRSEYMHMADGLDSSLQPRRLILKSSSTAHLQDLRNTSASPESRLPLLSFFASLFSIDDDTFALLSSSPNTQTSFLFRGPPTLVGLAFDEDDLIVAEKKRRVLLQLGDLYSSRLKEGVAVACDSEITPEDPFAMPFSLANIWALVGEVCQVPQKLWSDVWRPQEWV